MSFSYIEYDDFYLDNDFNLCHPDFGCLELGNVDNLKRLYRALRAIILTLEEVMRNK